MCKWGTETLLEVTIPAELSHTGQARQKVVGIDSCIASIVKALNGGGVLTTACCCGHGKAPGTIALADGRWLVVANDEGEVDRIASLEAEVERLKSKWESGEEWYIYNRDRNDARIRGPYSSNIIASAVRDEMETYGAFTDDNLVIMTEPKGAPHAQ